MASLAITNTLSNGATILASEHNTNYSDIVTYVNNRNAGSSTWDAVSISSASNVPFTANNSTGTQDIARFQDNGTNVLQILNGGIVNMASQSAARAYRNTSAQTLNDNSTTKIQFNAESFDVQSEFDSATNFRFTATKDGKYLVAAALTGVATSTTDMTIFIYKNGSEFSRAGMANPSSTCSVVISDVVSLSATDYIEIFANMNSNATTTNVSNGENLSFVAIHKVA